MDAILDTINKPNEAPGDYLGEDRLLYCGKCRTAKQTRIHGRLLYCNCACKEAELSAEKEREARRKTEELRERCLPAEDTRRHRFEYADTVKHIEIAKRYVEKWDEMRARNTGLLFWGNTGTGKSFTAHCIANALIDRGVPVRLYSAAEVIDRLSDREKRDGTREKMQTVPLLILDDLGAERETTFAREQLCAVIDERAESGKPLIVTSNYTVQEMDSCPDREMQRIFDRLKAMCVRVAVVGESRRREIGAQKLREAREILGL